MVDHDYTADKIKQIGLDDSVRARPAMYFGVSRDSGDLPSRILQGVIDEAVHPAPGQSYDEESNVVVDVLGDLEFSITDSEVPDVFGESPKLGYLGSLFGSDRWTAAAAAALSEMVRIEMWSGEHGFRQSLIRLKPVARPTPYNSMGGNGVKIDFKLDRLYFSSGARIADNISELHVHGEGCDLNCGARRFEIRDHRKSVR
ncbi:hypothetical protein AB0H98_01705 [Nocardia salmonicida]|uniref:hypothetical protein n=1 Tax=Nocardia salmonicida TaxID=53431 RepID=UPI0033E284B0